MSVRKRRLASERLKLEAEVRAAERLSKTLPVSPLAYEIERLVRPKNTVPEER